MPGNATKGAFRAGGADRNRTNGESQLLRAGVQRAQPFVHGYRECNTPVQVKGGSLAQLSGVAPLSTGYYLAQKCSKEAASLPLPLRGKSLKNGGTKFETDKTQRSCRKEWRLQSQAQ